MGSLQHYVTCSGLPFGFVFFFCNWMGKGYIGLCMCLLISFYFLNSTGKLICRDSTVCFSRTADREICL